MKKKKGFVRKKSTIFFLFTSNNSLWSASEGWISVTENIATSNPLQERRHGMKTETVLLVFYGNTSITT